MEYQQIASYLENEVSRSGSNNPSKFTTRN